MVQLRSPRQRSTAQREPRRTNLQFIAVGALFPAVPGATDGFHVLRFETERYLILGWQASANATPIMTWAFVPGERTDGSTRLIVRARGGRAYSFYGLPAWLGMPAVRLAHFFMERRQLHGIASRVESRQQAGHDDQRTEAA